LSQLIYNCLAALAALSRRLLLSIKGLC